jgi:serine phosphatase RsbU (regulator of sigma subunit)
MAVKTYDETRVVFTPEGEEPSVFSEEVASGRLEDATSNNKNAAIGASQTFRFYEVSDETPDEDFATLVENPTERANIINRALILKQQQYVRKTMLADGFAPVEGVYDLQSIVGQVAERKAADPATKAANAFSKLLGRQVSVEELNNLIQQMQGATA